MKKYSIFDIIKIALLAAIIVILLIINNNMRIIGHQIVSKFTKENTTLSQKATITKGKGILIGDSNAKLTVTAFIDYECVFCKRFMSEVYPSLVDEYISSGIINIEFRNLPLEMHEHSLFLAKTAVCAEKFGHYADFQNIIFKNQEKINPQYVKRVIFNLKIDAKKYNQCIEDSVIAQKIDFDKSECLKNKISGTPCFVINGNVYMGLIPYKDFKEIIKKELNPKTKENSNTCH